VTTPPNSAFLVEITKLLPVLYWFRAVLPSGPPERQERQERSVAMGHFT
jgi:hypothetical protein